MRCCKSFDDVKFAAAGLGLYSVMIGLLMVWRGHLDDVAVSVYGVVFSVLGALTLIAVIRCRYQEVMGE